MLLYSSLIYSDIEVLDNIHVFNKINLHWTDKNVDDFIYLLNQKMKKFNLKYYLKPVYIKDYLTNSLNLINLFKNESAEVLGEGFINQIKLSLFLQDKEAKEIISKRIRLVTNWKNVDRQKEVYNIHDLKQARKNI
ncbi:TPA: hypothetical protein MJF47_004071, partial [Clostridioides difficile]|nr:hypothetical protein [Clostridioides difficile]